MSYLESKRGRGSRSRRFFIFRFYKNCFIIVILLFNFFMKIIFIFSCSGIFRNVPCSWFYRQPTTTTLLQFGLLSRSTDKSKAVIGGVTLVRTPSRKWELNSNWLTARKECGSILSSHLWGGALRDDTKNGCVADYRGRGWIQDYCTCFHLPSCKSAGWICDHLFETDYRWECSQCRVRVRVTHRS